jgi:UDP-N-acetyl-D-glucosamine dehydrogenase
LSYNDPFVPSLKLGGGVLKSVEATPAEIARHDCVIILTDHSAYDIREIAAAARLVIDTRNSTKDLQEYKERIIKLGAGNNVPSYSTHDDDSHELPRKKTVAH